MSRTHTFTTLFLVSIFSLVPISNSYSKEDTRQYVEMPKVMQQHQLANMRDHLMAIDEILLNMGNGELDKAAEIAEERLGMSSLSKHGASHMAMFIPKEMGAIGISMHKAASRFALKAQEGDPLPAYKALQEVTSSCTACHAAYKTFPPKLSVTPEKNITDKRINLGFTPTEKAAFLSEMQQMLISIQGIMSGIGNNDPEEIIKAARYSGNRMARETPASIKKKTPPSFKEIGGPTHMMFEEVVIRAETDDMEDIAELTGRLMQQCVSCHATFKVSE